MIRCVICDKVMEKGVSCEDPKNDRVTYGKETRANFAEGNEFCHDCGCAIGQFHHLGCDVEECNVCHCQMIGCECEDLKSNETILDRVKLMLKNNGMFDNQVEEVIKEIIPHPTMREVSGRWKEKADDYPPQLMNIIYGIAKGIALHYIDTNCPEAFFRPMFLPLEEQNRLMNKEGTKSRPSKNIKDCKTVIKFGVSEVEEGL